MLIGKSPEYSVLSVFGLNNTETIIYCVVLFSYHFVDLASNLTTWIYDICMGSMLMLVCKWCGLLCFCSILQYYLMGMYWI